MSEREANSLWERLSEAGSLSNRWLHGAEASVNLAELSRGSCLAAPLDELRGASVLVLTKHQLPSALALIELDGVARRVVVCPLDLQPEHLPSIMETAKIDTVVGDRCLGVSRFVPCSTQITPAHRVRRCCQRTEWVLMTSGTTGVPKLVAHTLCSLSTAMTGRDPLGAGAVWSTFYDMRRYGGLQIFLRAMLGGGSMVLSSAEEPVGDFLTRAGRHGVTHISGTPSHWRRALMSSHADKMAPRYVRLSGEIADQAILDHLRAAFPDADIAHAFASTEAGVGLRRRRRTGRVSRPSISAGAALSICASSMARCGSSRAATRSAISATTRQRCSTPRALSTPATWSSCATAATTSSAGAAASSISAATRFIPRRSRRRSTATRACACRWSRRGTTRSPAPSSSPRSWSSPPRAPDDAKR